MSPREANDLVQGCTDSNDGDRVKPSSLTPDPVTHKMGNGDPHP